MRGRQGFLCFQRKSQKSRYLLVIFLHPKELFLHPKEQNSIFSASRVYFCRFFSGTGSKKRHISRALTRANYFARPHAHAHAYVHARGV